MIAVRIIGGQAVPCMADQTEQGRRLALDRCPKLATALATTQVADILKGGITPQRGRGGILKGPIMPPRVRLATSADLSRLIEVRHGTAENPLTDPSLVTDAEVAWYLSKAIFLVSEDDEGVQSFACANPRRATSGRFS